MLQNRYDTVLEVFPRIAVMLCVIYAIAWIVVLRSVIRNRKWSYLYPGLKRQLLFIPCYCLVAIGLTMLFCYVFSSPSIVGYAFVLLVFVATDWLAGRLMYQEPQYERTFEADFLLGTPALLLPIAVAHILVFGFEFFKATPWISQ